MKYNVGQPVLQDVIVVVRLYPEVVFSNIQVQVSYLGRSYDLVNQEFNSLIRNRVLPNV